jgi:hypothetical protein
VAAVPLPQEALLQAAVPPQLRAVAVPLKPLACRARPIACA